MRLAVPICVTARTDGDNFEYVFREAITAVTAASIKYVVSGMLAYNLYAPARYTRDIILIAAAADWPHVRRALRGAGFGETRDLPRRLGLRNAATTVGLKVLPATPGPESAALKDPEGRTILGIPALVVKPEHLLWMYCRSELSRHVAQAVEMVKAGKVDTDKLHRLLLQAGDLRARSRLRRVLRQAAAERHSSYSHSVAMRRRPAAFPG
jgi:hypothetical protein